MRYLRSSIFVLVILPLLASCGKKNGPKYDRITYEDVQPYIGKSVRTLADSLADHGPTHFGYISDPSDHLRGIKLEYLYSWQTMDIYFSQLKHTPLIDTTMNWDLAKVYEETIDTIIIENLDWGPPN